jgi:hypothetical protein
MFIALAHVFFFEIGSLMVYLWIMFTMTCISEPRLKAATRLEAPLSFNSLY